MKTSFKDVLLKGAELIILFGVSIAFACAFFYNTNPLSLIEGSTAKAHDPSCFFVIGNGITQGLTPYVDLLDNKGPVTYLIYALSQFFTDSLWGFVAVQIIGLFITLIAVGDISRSLGIKRPFIAQFIYLFYYALFDCGGGYTEELGNFFVILSFWVLVKFTVKYTNESKVSFWHGFLLGCFFWLCFMTRFNNALPIAGIVLGVLIEFIRKKRGKDILLCIGSFLAGTALVMAPIIVWLSLKGALSDWIYQTVTVNFGYSGVAAQSTFNILFFTDYGYKLLIIAFVGVVGYLMARHNGELLTSSKLFGFVTMISLAVSVLGCVKVSNYYIHYLLTCFVPSFMGAILYLACKAGKKDKEDKKKHICSIKTLCTAMICVSLLICFEGFETAYTGAARCLNHLTSAASGSLFGESVLEQEADKLVSQIPEDERSSVFTIDVPPNWFAVSDIVPCRRLFVCYPLFSSINADFKEEYASYFEEDEPKWLVTLDKIEDISLPELGSVLTDKYEFVGEFGTSNLDEINLYKLK